MDFSAVKEAIFYVTLDPARAIGLEKVLPCYHIVCLDDNPLVDLLLERGVKVFSLEKKVGRNHHLLRSTGSVLDHPLVKEYLKQSSKGREPNILFFKPSRKIDAVAKMNNYRLLGNRYELNNLYEDKISFYKLCLSWGIPVPLGEAGALADFSYQDLSGKYGQKLVIQFGHGWAGNTTFFAENEDDFKDLKARFPKREVRITRFIKGETYLVNACVTKEEVLVSPPAIQITAPEGFTASLGGTCGREWPAVLPDKVEAQITQYTQKVGEEMRTSGYRGYFGLDFLFEEETENLYLSECNARLTASVPLYTKMELLSNQVPLLFYHLLEFLGKTYQIENLVKKEMLGAELAIRNNQSKSVKVTADLPPGIYTYRKGLKFERAGYSLEDIKNSDEFFLLAAGCGRVVTSENEIARIDTLEKIVDRKGVKDWAKEALFTVKEQLRLKNDGDA